jgi:hypothetical protein
MGGAVEKDMPETLGRGRGALASPQHETRAVQGGKCGIGTSSSLSASNAAAALAEGQGGESDMQMRNGNRAVTYT